MKDAEVLVRFNTCHKKIHDAQSSVVSTRKPAEAWQKRNIYMKDFLSKTVLSLYVRLVTYSFPRENKTVIMVVRTRSTQHFLGWASPHHRP
jgi:hypothetical protein